MSVQSTKNRREVLVDVHDDVGETDEVAELFELNRVVLGRQASCPRALRTPSTKGVVASGMP